VAFTVTMPPSPPSPLGSGPVPPTAVIVTLVTPPGTVTAYDPAVVGREQGRGHGRRRVCRKSGRCGKGDCGQSPDHQRSSQYGPQTSWTPKIHLNDTLHSRLPTRTRWPTTVSSLLPSRSAWVAFGPLSSATWHRIGDRRCSPKCQDHRGRGPQITGKVGHFAAHLAPGAYYRDRLTGLFPDAVAEVSCLDRRSLGTRHAPPPRIRAATPSAAA
jgi:hypothetical protein